MDSYYKKYEKYKTKYLALKNVHIETHQHGGLVNKETDSRLSREQNNSLLQKSSKYNKIDPEITVDLVPYNF